MKNTRCFKWIVWLLAIMMGLSLTAAVADEDTKSSGGFQTGLMESRPLDSSFVKVAKTLDKDGKEVDLSQVDPNASYTLHLEIEEPAGAENGSKLPESTQDVVLFYALENMTATGGSNDDVSWTYDSGDVVFQWKNGKVDSFTADIAVSPAYPAEVDRSGSYVLVSKTMVMATDEKLNYDNRGRVVGTAVTKRADGKYVPEGYRNTTWTLTHVTGDWYTVSSNGKYMQLKSGNHLYLTDEANAQKIQVIESGENGYYYFTADGVTLSRSGNTSEKGISAWINTDRKENEKFQMIPLSDVSSDATVDLSGTWALLNTNQKAMLSTEVFSGNNKKLHADFYALKDNNYLPYNNVRYWTFEHVTRDWYYISSNGQYLNVSSSGLTLSDTKQPILAKSNDNFATIILTDNDVTARASAVTLMNGKVADGFGITKYAINNNTKLKRASQTEIPYGKTNITGTYVVTTESSKAMMGSEPFKSDASKLQSYSCVMNPDGTVDADVEDNILWTFNKVEGDLYTITANGQYLTLGSSQAGLTDTPAELYIQEYNGKIRITTTTGYVLNNKDNKATNGYQGYQSTNVNDAKEWHTLALMMDEGASYLLFNNNGGTEAAPTSYKVEAGQTTILPNYTGTRNGKRFIGWALTENIYKDNQYREVYMANSEYKPAEGSTTLYAVFNDKESRSQFGFRGDKTIPHEPGNYEKSNYYGHFFIDNAVKDGKWVVDVDSKKTIEGNHIKNAVTDNLETIPDDETIKAHVKDYDPETQYVHWYVLKWMGSWHVDGVIRDRADKSVGYNTNVGGTNNLSVENMPAGYSVKEGKFYVVGTDVNGKIKEPTREGYVFTGWNTEPDGSGTGYMNGDEIAMNDSINLYAQWIKKEELKVSISSNWPEGKMGYKGAKITMTGHLYGFEEKTSYTLQWQYSTDDGENWIDVEGANEITYTYELDEVTTTYIWRIIAKDIV